LRTPWRNCSGPGQGAKKIRRRRIELENAEKFLASRQKEIERLQSGIENARVAVEQAKADLPAAIKAADAAKQAHEKAMATTWKAMDALGMSGILGSAALDAKLAQCMVIATANPRDLAKFVEKSPGTKLIQQLLANEDLDDPDAGCRWPHRWKIR
jgi:hypothetical protein